MDITTFLSSLRSPKYESFLKYGGFVLIGLIIFIAGAYVGHRMTDFAYRWDANYSHEFAGPGSPFGPGGDDRPSMPHGTFGSVIGVNWPSFAIKGPREAERIVVIGTTTAIRYMHSYASTTDIHVGSMVVVLGEPDDEGKIVATLIRIMPPASSTPTSMDATSSFQK